MTAGVLKPSNRIRVSTSRKVFLVINTVLLLLLCAAMLYPVIFVTAASFSEKNGHS
jgi:putative aldouronate transport system permease protein